MFYLGIQLSGLYLNIWLGTTAPKSMGLWRVRRVGDEEGHELGLTSKLGPQAGQSAVPLSPGRLGPTICEHHLFLLGMRERGSALGLTRIWTSSDSSNESPSNCPVELFAQRTATLMLVRPAAFVWATMAKLFSTGSCRKT